MTNKIPFWEKYMLTTREAAEYFHIGEKRLRAILAANPDATFLIMNGSRQMIKRDLFAKYLDAATVI